MVTMYTIESYHNFWSLFAFYFLTSKGTHMLSGRWTSPNDCSPWISVSTSFLDQSIGLMWLNHFGAYERQVPLFSSQASTTLSKHEPGIEMDARPKQHVPWVSVCPATGSLDSVLECARSFASCRRHESYLDLVQSSEMRQEQTNWLVLQTRLPL